MSNAIKRWRALEIPDRAIPLGQWGPAFRWWWGPFIFSQFPTGYVDGHVHRPDGHCCGLQIRVNPGEWG